MDIAQLRRDTPGCNHVLHFNNAGASLLPLPVFNRVRRHQELERDIGGYEAATITADDIDDVYSRLARLVSATPDEIAVVENATRAWDMAFYGINFSPGDRIVTTESSYASNFMAFLQASRKSGAIIDIVPNDKSGQVDLDALQRALAPKTRVVCLTHAPGNSGVVHPAKTVGEIARNAGVPFLLDACQSVGQMPIDVGDVGCDMLSATGRKFLRAPRGTGFLYVREAFLNQLEPPFVDLHAAEWIAADRYKLRPNAKRFETWEGNVAAKLGLGQAAEYATNIGLDAIWERVRHLAGLLRSRLQSIPTVEIHDRGPLLGAIVTFSAERVAATDLQGYLRKHNANVTVSAPSTTLLDATARALPDMVRASVHYYNTEDEVDRFCDLIATAIASR